MGVRRILVVPRDSVGASARFCWCIWAKWLMKWLHHAKAPPHRGVLCWEWGNKDVYLVTTFVFFMCPSFIFFSRSFIVKTCSQNAQVWYRSRQWNRIARPYLCNAPFGNKMIELSNIDSYHETLIHIAYHGRACSICVQIIQRILCCNNGFCNFHWNCIQRILCSYGNKIASWGYQGWLNTN